MWYFAAYMEAICQQNRTSSRGPSPKIYVSSESLQCYSCPTTVSDDVQSANIDCLANGTETQCQPYQVRTCHSVRACVCVSVSVLVC